jgi:hypothetical protein
MRGVHIALPLVLVTTLMACQSGDDSRAPNDPVSPSAPETAPSSGAAVVHSTVDFFFLNDFDRDISATIGLVSPVADLDEDPDCGGSGPRIVDTASRTWYSRPRARSNSATDGTKQPLSSTTGRRMMSASWRPTPFSRVVK